MQKLIATLLFAFSFVVYAQDPVPAAADSETPVVSVPAAKEKVKPATEKATKTKAAKAKKELSPKQIAQRAKMKSCNKSAKEQDLHGDPRKAFMKGCLKKTAPTP